MTALQKRLQDHIDGRAESLSQSIAFDVRMATTSGCDHAARWWNATRGLPIRLAGTARDVSTSRNAERERRVAAEVLKSMGEAVAVCDLQLHLSASIPPSCE